MAFVLVLRLSRVLLVASERLHSGPRSASSYSFRAFVMLALLAENDGNAGSMQAMHGKKHRRSLSPASRCGRNYVGLDHIGHNYISANSIGEAYRRQAEAQTRRAQMTAALDCCSITDSIASKLANALDHYNRSLDIKLHVYGPDHLGTAAVQFK